MADNFPATNIFYFFLPKWITYIMYLLILLLAWSWHSSANLHVASTQKLPFYLKWLDWLVLEDTLLSCLLVLPTFSAWWTGLLIKPQLRQTTCSEWSVWSSDYLMSSRPFEKTHDINKGGNSYRITTVVKAIKEKMKLIHMGWEYKEYRTCDVSSKIRRQCQVTAIFFAKKSIGASQKHTDESRFPADKVPSWKAFLWVLSPKAWVLYLVYGANKPHQIDRKN